MNDKQKNTYLKVLQSTLRTLERNSTNPNYFVKCREISNILIPIIKVVVDGDSAKNEKEQGKEDRIDNMIQEITRESEGNIINYVSDKISSKFAQVIKNITQEEYGEGTHFVFSSFYYSGVYSLGKILETMGWKDLTEDLDSINNERSNKNFVIWSGSLNKRKTKGEKIKDVTKKKR